MSFSDPDPHRRNLIVASLALIALHLGDGRLDQILESHEPYAELLRAGMPFAVAPALWFAFRYLQKTPDTLKIFKTALKSAVQEHFFNNPLITKDEGPKGTRHFGPSSKNINLIYPLEGQLQHARLVEIRPMSEMSTGFIETSPTDEELQQLSESGISHLSLWAAICAAMKIRFAVIIKKVELSDRLVPWAAFWVALVIAVWEGVRVFLL